MPASGADWSGASPPALPGDDAADDALETPGTLSPAAASPASFGGHAGDHVPAMAAASAEPAGGADERPPTGDDPRRIEAALAIGATSVTLPAPVPNLDDADLAGRAPADENVDEPPPAPPDPLFAAVREGRLQPWIERNRGKIWIFGIAALTIGSIVCMFVFIMVLITRL